MSNETGKAAHQAFLLEQEAQIVGVVLQGETRMNDELKQLIEDAAKLLGLRDAYWPSGKLFNPLDPERGDLMKVAVVAGLCVNHDIGWVGSAKGECFYFTKGDYQSLALAVLRAASAVWKARNGNAE